MKKKNRVALKISLGVLSLSGIILGAVAAKPKLNKVANANTDAANQSLNTGYVSSSTDTSAFAETVQDGQILQCFCWSYKEIMQYLPKIAAQGFTAIQTSPVQVCKEQTVDDGEGNARIAKDMWWAYYQPAAFTVDDTGDNALGTPEEFGQMCEMAHSYGVKVLVDVVANHLGNQWVADSLCERSYYYEWEIAGMPCSYEDGGYIPYTGNYWAYGSGSAVAPGSANASDTKEIDTYYYKETLKFHPYLIQDNDEPGNVTQGNIGMMDLDTSDIVVQDAVADYLEELIDYGVDGFRFDAAKHIETPYDQISSNFWPYVMQRAEARANSYGRDIYAYGEILNRPGIGRSLSWYTDCGVAITDSGMGHNIVENGGVGFSSFNYADDNDYGAYRTNMVTWAESHDNYMGTQDTHNKSETVINRSYAILSARKDFATLYCARFEDYNESTLGNVACENGWSYDCIGAVNKFHNYYATVNADELCYQSGNYTVIERFNNYQSNDNGVVIVGNQGNCSISTTHLANGTYTDAVTGNTFTVSNGVLTGYVGDSEIAVIYNAMPQTNPSISASKDSCTFKTDTLTVTYTFKNAASASVVVDGVVVSTSTTSTTYTVANLNEGETATVVVTVLGTDGSTISKTYTYTKATSMGSAYLYFANTNNWSNVYAYCWNDETGAKNSSWPGVSLTETKIDENGNTCYVLDFDLDTYDHVIFNNSNDQTVDILVSGSTEYIISGSTNGKYNVSEVEFVEFDNPGPEPYGEIEVDFANTNNWSNVYAYVWNATTLNNMGGWPGIKLTTVGTDVNGYAGYTITVNLDTYDHIIFNNGNSGNGNQTADLALDSETTGFTASGLAYDFVESDTPDNEEITVYFENTNNWSCVYAYVWNNTTLKNMGGWPGIELTSVGTDKEGYTAYAITVDLASYDCIIFNNGNSGNGNQTADLTLTSATTGFTASGASYSFEEGEVVETTITVYFLNTSNWSNVYAYVWNNSTYDNNGNWPGNMITKVGYQNGYDVYSVTVDLALYDYIIFNNGNGGNGNQTANLALNTSSTGFNAAGQTFTYIG